MRVTDGLRNRITPSTSTIAMTSVECCTRARNRASFSRAARSFTNRAFSPTAANCRTTRNAVVSIAPIDNTLNGAGQARTATTRMRPNRNAPAMYGSGLNGCTAGTGSSISASVAGHENRDSDQMRMQYAPRYTTSVDVSPNHPTLRNSRSLARSDTAYAATPTTNHPRAPPRLSAGRRMRNVVRPVSNKMSPNG